MIIAIPSSPTQISSTLMVKVETSGSGFTANTSLTLKLLVGLQALPSVTFIIMILCEPEVVVNEAAGIVNVPVPPLIVTLVTKSFALLGAPKS